MKNPRRKALLIILGYLVGFSCHAQADIELSIQAGDYALVKTWIIDHDVNSRYGSRNYTPLIYASIFDKPAIINLLTDAGANTEVKCDSKTALFFALEYKRRAAVRALLKKGASTNVADTLLNTPLFYAVSHDDLPMVKLLIRHGVPLNAKNKLRVTAREYAIRINSLKSAKYIMLYYEKHLPSWCDGPYVYWQNAKKVKVYYIIHDSASNHTSLNSEFIKVPGDKLSFQGYGCDNSIYTIPRKFEKPASVFRDSAKIFVMGDVHGDYIEMVNLLRAGEVIDSNLNWRWGKNHLVFLGDIMDRGEKVTECLWLIYKLEQQARMAGGYVHYLLGNHEVMITQKDQRFISEKYFYLNDRLRLSYSSHFRQHSEFNRWLIKHPVVVKIDDYLFVHAGISMDIAQKKYSIDEINRSMEQYLTERKHKKMNDTLQLVTGMNGPLWYRGYLNQNRDFKPISSEEVKYITSFYNVSAIFIGHTALPEITSLFNGQVVSMDVPYYLDDAAGQALLIENGVFYKIYENGQKVLFEAY
jgi:hypothetical protein